MCAVDEWIACTGKKRGAAWNLRSSLRDENRWKAGDFISTVGLCACERTCVFVVAGCGLSDRVGRAAGVEITLVFAWAAAVICFDELYKSRAAGRRRDANEWRSDDNAGRADQWGLKSNRQDENVFIGFWLFDYYPIQNSWHRPPPAEAVFPPGGPAPLKPSGLCEPVYAEQAEY